MVPEWDVGMAPPRNEWAGYPAAGIVYRPREGPQGGGYDNVGRRGQLEADEVDG
jgi:hypothetical protein